MDMFGNSLSITCGDGRSADKKSSVNQRVEPIKRENVAVFLLKYVW